MSTTRLTVKRGCQRLGLAAGDRLDLLRVVTAPGSSGAVNLLVRHQRLSGGAERVLRVSSPAALSAAEFRASDPRGDGSVTLSREQPSAWTTEIPSAVPA